MTLEDVAEAPLPFSIIPVVFLSGSDYDMGRQYGQQLAEHIACRIDYWWARASRTYGGSAAREAILRDLNAGAWHIKTDAPELVEMLKGMAEGDTPYAPLSALLSQARQEDYKGCAAADTAEAIAVGAREAPKEQNRVLNGRAATHFARCQAKARQVCNALVPPATEPEDLGLVRPWPYIRWERPPHETAWEQIQPKPEVD